MHTSYNLYKTVNSASIWKYKLKHSVWWWSFLKYKIWILQKTKQDKACFKISIASSEKK